MIPLLVLAIFDDPEAARSQLTADQIALPAGVSGETFALQLLVSERLTPWNPKEPIENGSILSRMAFKTQIARNGREVTVYYDPRMGPAAARHVCRIRRAAGGFAEVRYAALRWCAASFHVRYPADRPPPIVAPGDTLALPVEE